MIPDYLRPFFWKNSYADGDKGRLLIPGHKTAELVLVLNRYRFGVNCTRGKLICGDAVFETLEPVKRNDDLKPQCIPTGRYKITFYDSPKHGYLLPLLHDVEGFEWVEIHKGNYPHDTQGCILVGVEGVDNAIYHSKIAFDKIMEALKQAETNGQSMAIEIVEMNK